MKTLNIILIIFVCLLVNSFCFAQEISLNWNDCVREAIKNNPQLSASTEAIKASRASKWVSASPLFPQVTTSLSGTKSDAFSGGSERTTNNYFVKGEQLIFDGFKTFSDVKSSQENIKASEFNYTITSSEIRYNLRSAFVDLLRAQSLIPVVRGIIERRKQNLNMIRLKYNSGREHEGSLLLAEADLAQAEYDLKKAERDVLTAEYALKKELGRNDDVSIKVVGDFKANYAEKETPDIKAIADAHPAIKKIQAEVKSAEYNLDSAKADFFPIVKLNAEAGKIRPTGLSNSEHGWSAGLNLSLPIFEGTKRIANTQKSRAMYMQAQLNRRSQYDATLSSLEKAWQDFRDAIDNEKLQSKYLKASEVRAKISRTEYANGLLSFDNWIIIEDNFIRAQKTYISAQAGMLTAEANWIRAKGKDLEYD